MSTERGLSVVYVGVGLSGRSTSVSVALGALGKPATPLEVMCSDGCEVLSPSGRRLTLRVSRARSLWGHAPPIPPGEHPEVQAEMGWLAGADGFVFVLDSQEPRFEANEVHLENLERDLRALGLDIHDRPIVFQANKRDLEWVTPAAVLRQRFRTRRSGFVESSAISGRGVVEALDLLVRLIDTTRGDRGGQDGGATDDTPG